jgi:hypothetical protein
MNKMNASNNYGVDVEYLPEPPAVVYVDMSEPVVTPTIEAAQVPNYYVEELEDESWAEETERFVSERKANRKGRYDDWSYSDLSLN